MTLPTITAAVFFVWMSVTLQSIRIRDISWNPVCVIPAWSVGEDHHGTLVGTLVDLGLLLAPLFLPGGDYETPTYGGDAGKAG